MLFGLTHSIIGTFWYGGNLLFGLLHDMIDSLWCGVDFLFDRLENVLCAFLGWNYLLFDLSHGVGDSLWRGNDLLFDFFEGVGGSLLGGGHLLLDLAESVGDSFLSGSYLLLGFLHGIGYLVSDLVQGWSHLLYLLHSTCCILFKVHNDVFELALDADRGLIGAADLKHWMVNVHIRVFTRLTEIIIGAHGAFVANSHDRINATAITVVACVFDLSLFFKQGGESFAAVFLHLLELCGMASWEEVNTHTRLTRASLFVHLGIIAD